MLQESQQLKVRYVSRVIRDTIHEGSWKFKTIQMEMLAELGRQLPINREDYSVRIRWHVSNHPDKKAYYVTLTAWFE